MLTISSAVIWNEEQNVTRHNPIVILPVGASIFKMRWKSNIYITQITSRLPWYAHTKKDFGHSSPSDGQKLVRTSFIPLSLQRLFPTKQ